MRKPEGELRPLLFEWDPFDCAEDLPSDEYDHLMSQLLTWWRGHPSGSIARSLHRQARNRHGPEPG